MWCVTCCCLELPLRVAERFVRLAEASGRRARRRVRLEHTRRAVPVSAVAVRRLAHHRVAVAGRVAERRLHLAEHAIHVLAHRVEMPVEVRQRREAVVVLVAAQEAAAQAFRRLTALCESARLIHFTNAALFHINQKV